MTDFAGTRTLGRSGLVVGPLGVSGGYGAPAAAFEMAFEQGCTYFYHGSRRAPGMAAAFRTLGKGATRDKLVAVAQVYARSTWYLRRSLLSFFKGTGLAYADVLLLGWHNRPPSPRFLDACETLRREGLFRHLAISGHHRPLFPDLASDPRYGLFHLRYNAAHRGAETEVFPQLLADRPGIVVYTATRWGDLLNPKRMPEGSPTPRASDCYRFVLSNPSVDVCMTGPKTLEEMKEALTTLTRGPMTEDELAWMHRVGEKVRGRTMPWVYGG